MCGHLTTMCGHLATMCGHLATMCGHLATIHVIVNYLLLIIADDLQMKVWQGHNERYLSTK